MCFDFYNIQVMKAILIPGIYFFLILFFAYQSVSAEKNTVIPDTLTIATGLDTPWEILWGPDDYLWITERFGRISRIHPETGQRTTVHQIADVYEQSESGLLGMALHPDFDNSPYVFIAYTYLSNSNIKLRIIRFTYSGESLTNPMVLIEDIPGNGNHNGCRLKIGPDNKLYATTGDAQNTAFSQNSASLAGKILRMNLDGSIPADNPFAESYIYTLGHRNPQGLTFGPGGKLYSSEHGPSNDDELNLIESARNYGWPSVSGFCNLPAEQTFCNANAVKEPMAAWTPTLAVAGLEYYGNSLIQEWNNSLLLVSLKASRLTVLKLNDEGDSIVSSVDYFNNWWGRLRDVCVSPAGKVFLASSNKDGRGIIKPGDDRIIQLSVSGGNPTGIQHSKNEAIKIYPVPLSENTLHIEGLEPSSRVKIRIFDVLGKQTGETAWYQSAGSMLNINFNYPPGIYIVEVSGTGFLTRLKLIKN